MFADKQEQVKLMLPADLNADLTRIAGRRAKSEWITEAIRQRISRESSGESAGGSDLPASAKVRIAEYTRLVCEAVRDEELQALELAWTRESDDEYYGVHPFVPSTLEACVDVLVGRGGQRRIPAAAGCI